MDENSPHEPGPLHPLSCRSQHSNAHKYIQLKGTRRQLTCEKDGEETDQCNYDKKLASIVNAAW